MSIDETGGLRRQAAQNAFAGLAWLISKGFALPESGTVRLGTIIFGAPVLRAYYVYPVYRRNGPNEYSMDFAPSVYPPGPPFIGACGTHTTSADSRHRKKFIDLHFPSISCDGRKGMNLGATVQRARGSQCGKRRVITVWERRTNYINSSFLVRKEGRKDERSRRVWERVKIVV